MFLNINGFFICQISKNTQEIKISTKTFNDLKDCEAALYIKAVRKLIMDFKRKILKFEKRYFFN